MHRLLVVVCSFLLLIISACNSYPTNTVSQGGERPALIVQGDIDGAVLFVDGLDMGEASKYNGKPSKLLIEKGPHTIQVLKGGAAVLEQKIFVTEGETKVISVSQ